MLDGENGYYQKSDVFSQKGDFTTSPEISTLFGEMIGIWIAYFLGKRGYYEETNKKVTKRFRLVELGPGRGALMRDILKAFEDLGINNDFELCLV